jgi:hypothetical protein
LSNMRAVNKHTHTRERERVARRVEKKRRKWTKRLLIYAATALLFARRLISSAFGMKRLKIQFQIVKPPVPKKPMHRRFYLLSRSILYYMYTIPINV